MNRVNLWHSILSISSACLILILSRIELIEGSMRTRSFSLREIISGLSKTSLDPLEICEVRQCWVKKMERHAQLRLQACCVVPRPERKNSPALELL